MGAVRGAADGLGWFALTAAHPAALAALDDLLRAGGPGRVAGILAAAVVAGALVVGSVERRVVGWMRGRDAGKEAGGSGGRGAAE